MANEEMKKKIFEKIQQGTFSVNDIDEYIRLFVQLANESEDVEYEIEGWDRTLNFEIEDAKDFSLVVEDGKITLNEIVADADIIFILNGEIASGVFTGEVDTTSAYMSGDLKINGPLPDAVKFRTIIELVREELEDDW